MHIQHAIKQYRSVSALKNWWKKVAGARVAIASAGLVAHSPRDLRKCSFFSGCLHTGSDSYEEFYSL